MVLDIKELHEWRSLSKDGSQVLPWYTRPALDVLEAVDLSDKVVFEWGGGVSTIYYAKHAKEVFTVDWNTEWVEHITDTLTHHNLKATVFSSQNPEEYVNMVTSPNVPKPDVFIVDGSVRDECLFKALEIMTQGDILIYDNWCQEEVCMPSQEAQDEVKKYDHKIFKQEGHPHWKTLILWK